MVVKKNRKIPQSVKVHKRIEAEVALALSNQALEYEKLLQEQNAENNSNESEKIQKLRLTLSQRESELDHLQLEMTEKKKLLITQGQRSSALSERVRDLKYELSQKQQTITRLNNDLELSQSQFVTAEILPFVNKNFVVHNWKDSWKWISNWAFGLVMFFAVTPTQAAMMIAEAAPDDSDMRTQAVLSLMQTQLFDTLIALQEAGAEGVDPAKRLALISSCGKGIASIAQASIGQKKWMLDVRDRVQKAANEVESIVKKGGLSAETAADIRAQILGIAK
ncbi:hypothetical protein D3C78_16780 [compost metagenome]